MAASSACRTRKSCSGLRASGLPSLPVMKGVVSRAWSIAMYTSREEMPRIKWNRASALTRSLPWDGAPSIMSRSPASNDASRDPASVTTRSRTSAQGSFGPHQASLRSSSTWLPGTYSLKTNGPVPMAARLALNSDEAAPANLAAITRTRLSELVSSGSGACVSISSRCGSGAAIALMLRV